MKKLIMAFVCLMTIVIGLSSCTNKEEKQFIQAKDCLEKYWRSPIKLISLGEPKMLPFGTKTPYCSREAKYQIVGRDSITLHFDDAYFNCDNDSLVDFIDIVEECPDSIRKLIYIPKTINEIDSIEEITDSII